MARYPDAVWRPIDRNHGTRRSRTRAVVLHVDAGGAESLHGWFNNPAALASSHFYVRYDGTVEQYLDTDVVAWTQRDGNASCVGVETQGKGDGAWTEKQLAALAPLLVWLCDLYNLPRVDVRNSLPASTGIGLHRYGCSPWRVRGGEVWGPDGKVCPGDLRVAQFPGLLARINHAPDEVPDVQEDDMPIIYRAGGYPAGGVLAHNGGWVLLRSAEEKQNLLKAGAREVWVEQKTLDALIADARGAETAVAIRGGL